LGAFDKQFTFVLKTDENMALSVLLAVTAALLVGARARPLARPLASEHLESLAASPSGGVIQCTYDADCGHGPNGTRICRCSSGYLSVKGTCNYEQKKQLVAFVLAFFVGVFGADCIYLGLCMSVLYMIGFWLHGVIVTAVGSINDGHGHR